MFIWGGKNYCIYSVHTGSQRIKQTQTAGLVETGERHHGTTGKNLAAWVLVQSLLML